MLPLFVWEASVNNGKVIFNGASSSGKTSILHILQDLTAEPYLEAGLDKFIFMLPKRYLERPLWDNVLGLADRAGQTGHNLTAGMHAAVAALSRAGNNVLVDHVLVEPAWVEDCAGLFAQLPAYLVGVRCPMDILEARERSRKNRTLGQARLQFETVHQYVVYDLEVDTAVQSPAECAQAILARVQEPLQAFQRLRRGLPSQR